MRAFIAMVLPEDVTQHLSRFLEPRQQAGEDNWRWTRPEQLHLTLAFLPDLPERAEEDVIEAGALWAARQHRPRMALHGAGAFPDPAAAKVLWVGVHGEDGADLGRWAHAIRGWASHAGTAVQAQSFRAHVTVARARGHRGAPGARLLQALDGYRSPAWEVESLVLVASHLGQGPGGTPRHRVLHEWTVPAGTEEMK